MVWQRWPYTVTRTQPVLVDDEYGNPVRSKGAEDDLVGDMQPVYVDETRDGISNIDTDEVRFLFPAGTVIGSDDTLTVAGDEFEVIGPDVNRDTGSVLDYVRIRARRTS